MRNIKLSIVLISILILASCQRNNNVPQPAAASRSSNQIDVNGTVTATPHCYLILPNAQAAGIKSVFGLMLSDGRMDANAPHGFEASTTCAAIVRHSFGGKVANETLIPITTGSHPLNDESTAFHTINSWQNTPYVQNGVNYDIPNDNFGTVLLKEELTAGGINITAFTVDYITRTGTVDFTYTMQDSNGKLSSGSYSGNFTIINRG